MVQWLTKLFQKTKPAAQFSAEDEQRYYRLKQAGLEKVLGPMHDLVGHAVVPFHVGGAVDMYYFPRHLPGTGFATMELIEPDGQGPKPNRIGTYELVAFTRLPMPALKEKADANLPFNHIERRLCHIFTMTGFYSQQAVLAPRETCEIPVEGQPNRCLILDEYAPNGTGFYIGRRRHCLLLCMEIFRSEMEFAIRDGGAMLLAKLKARGHYPYSDLDRQPVV